VLKSETVPPRVINVDKNAAYPKATSEPKAEKELPESWELRQNKYLNNWVEPDHKFIIRNFLQHNPDLLIFLYR